jgi:hypothetical protein
MIVQRQPDSTVVIGKVQCFCAPIVSFVAVQHVLKTFGRRREGGLWTDHVVFITKKNTHNLRQMFLFSRGSHGDRLRGERNWKWVSLNHAWVQNGAELVDVICNSTLDHVGAFIVFVYVIENVYIRDSESCKHNYCVCSIIWWPLSHFFREVTHAYKHHGDIFDNIRRSPLAWGNCS